MKKIILYILPFFLLSIFYSCNKDDAAPQQEEQEQEEEVLDPPSVFSISIQPSFASASVEWTVGEGANNENLLYSIFLDNLLIEESITTTNFLIENLEFSTSYTIKVTAKNSTNETSVEDSFQTLNPDNFNLYISKFINPNSQEYILNFNYNQQNDISSFHSQYDYSVIYTYDINQNLIQQKIDCCLFQHTTIDLSYENNQLVDVFILHRDENSFNETSYEFDIPTFDMYTVEVTKEDFDGNTIDSKIFQIELEHDTENLITQYKKTNLGTQETVEFRFEYENGNLVKFISVNDNFILDVAYDSMNNFKSFKHYNYERIVNSSFIFFKYENINFQKEMLFIPQFTFFNNKNNPINYSENGNIVKQFEYDYNELGYPVLMKNLSTGNIIQGFEYLIIEND